MYLNYHRYLTGLSEEQCDIRTHNMIILQAQNSGINCISPVERESVLLGPCIASISATMKFMTFLSYTGMILKEAG